MGDGTYTIRRAICGADPKPLPSEKNSTPKLVMMTDDKVNWSHFQRSAKDFDVLTDVFPKHAFYIIFVGLVAIIHNTCTETHA